MAFSRAQQPEFRRLIKSAAKFCGVDMNGPDYRAWYEAALLRAVEKTSTTRCDVAGDYDWVMAEFERLGQAGIRWQIKAATGDMKRMLFEVRKTCGQEADIDEAYVLRIGAQMLGVDRCPPLYELTRRQRASILVACKQHVTRQAVRRLERDPQVSEATGVWKRGQARAWRDAIKASQEVDEPF